MPGSFPGRRGALALHACVPHSGRTFPPHEAAGRPKSSPPHLPLDAWPRSISSSPPPPGILSPAPDNNYIHLCLPQSISTSSWPVVIRPPLHHPHLQFCTLFETSSTPATHPPYLLGSATTDLSSEHLLHNAKMKTSAVLVGAAAGLVAAQTGFPEGFPQCGVSDPA